jgi:hypothetical protein
MKRILGVALIALALPSLAGAVPPALSTITVNDRHVEVTFSAPKAGYATIYFATKPDRSTDGQFFAENVAYSESLTDSEIQFGRWVSDSRLDPGTYWVMMRADPSFDACYISGSGTYDASCANGYSETVRLDVPRPTIRYAAAVQALRYVAGGVPDARGYAARRESALQGVLP